MRLLPVGPTRTYPAAALSAAAALGAVSLTLDPSTTADEGNRPS
ncbi:hypothetical protein ACIGHB_30730 [Streptomyces sp. NPDC085460]